MGIFRIAMGIVTTVMYFCLLPNWHAYFSSTGMLSLGAIPPNDIWSVFQLTDGLFSPIVYWVIGTLAAMALTVGFQTRVCTIILYVLQVSMIHRNHMVVNGEDLVFRMLLLYSMFATMDNSVFKKGSKGTIWPVRLMQLNVLAIYVFSLPIKLMSDSAWLDGSLMYWVMVNKTWSRWPWPQMFYSGFFSTVIVKIMTFSGLLVELTFPILVWFKKTRLYIIAAIATFHLSIAIILKNVTFFSLSMVCAFVVFVPGEDMRKLVASLLKNKDLLISKLQRQQ